MSARSSTTDSASPLSEYRGLISSQVALSSRTDSNSPVSDYQGLSRRTDSQVCIIMFIYIRAPYYLKCCYLAAMNDFLKFSS